MCANFAVQMLQSQQPWLLWFSISIPPVHSTSWQLAIGVQLPYCPKQQGSHGQIVLALMVETGRAAGEPISTRWTSSIMREIKRSRIETTRKLVVCG